MASLKNPKADLRSKYSRFIKLGLILALTFIIIAFKFSPKSVTVMQKKVYRDPFIPVQPPTSTIQKPKPPEPHIVPDINTSSNDVFSDDIILDDIDDYKPSELPDNPPKPDIDLSDEIFIEIPEKLPEPVGGLKTLQEKVHYTEFARRIELQGTVFIQAKIDKNGDVVEATVLKGLGAGLDEEALNAVKSTKFYPGKQRGKPVNVKMVIPVKFVLKG
jgi:protein TonB